jgi:hypothetical protein
LHKMLYFVSPNLIFLTMNLLRFYLLFFVCNVCAQNVGINTSNPSAALDIQSTGNTATTMAVSISNSNNDTLWVLRDNGNVGIGTTQPTAPLEVQTQNAIAARFSAPIEGQPAVNVNELVTLGQLQAVSAAGNSTSSGLYALPTEWSNENPNPGTLISGAMYCRNLTQGGHTDWRLPSMEEFMYLITNSSVSLPSLSFTFGYYWLRASNIEHGSTSTNTPGRFNTFYYTGDWNTSYINVTSSAQSHYSICVR